MCEYLDPVVRTVWGGLGGVALLDRFSWAVGFEVSKAHTIPDFLHLVLVDKDVSAQLLLSVCLPTCCHSYHGLALRDCTLPRNSSFRSKRKRRRWWCRLHSSLNIFDLWLVEFMDMKPIDTKGWPEIGSFFFIRLVICSDFYEISKKSYWQ